MTDLDLVRELEIIRTDLTNAGRVMQQATSEIAGLRAENAMMRQALADIREGRGAFSPDQHQFAVNVIETAKDIARQALAGIYERE